MSLSRNAGLLCQICWVKGIFRVLTIRGSLPEGCVEPVVVLAVLSGRMVELPGFARCGLHGTAIISTRIYWGISTYSQHQYH